MPEEHKEIENKSQEKPNPGLILIFGCIAGLIFGLIHVNLKRLGYWPQNEFAEIMIYGLFFGFMSLFMRLMFPKKNNKKW